MSGYASRFERVREDGARRARLQQRINLVVAGGAIWLVGPLLVFAGVDGYRDGLSWRDGSASTTATVVERGSAPSRGAGSERNMLVEYVAGGRRHRARVLLPSSARVGSVVRIEYAVSKPTVASLPGRRAPVHGPWGWVHVVVTPAVWLAAIATHTVLVRRHRRVGPSVASDS